MVPAERRLWTPYYLGALWAWTIVSTSLVLTVAILSGNPVFRAHLLMGAGLVLFWVVLAGGLMVRFRDPIRDVARRIPVPWQVKFVLFCILLALLEEAVTVTMTNLAPVFGVPLGSVMITASTNYFDVVLRHSVVVFVPWFIGWAWLLKRWDFHPNVVLILFGLTGTLAEMGFGGPQHFTEYGMWTFVYGWMIYLPAYSLPPDRGARPAPGWIYPIAVVMPAPGILLLPILLAASLLEWLSARSQPASAGP